MKILCMRPERDFAEVGVAVPADLDVTFVDNERAIDAIPADVACLVLPSAGAHLAPELFAHAEALSLIQYTGAGVDRVAPAIVEELGAAVCNVPGASAPDVAAYVALSAGSLLRRLPLGDRLVKAGRYGEARAELVPAKVRGFRGLRVGVAGFGSIGVETAKIFEAFGAVVSWFDVFDSTRPEAARFARLSLDELVATSEVLTVHVPLSAQTTGLIGAAELAALPKGAIVVNAARGGIVDEEALIAALDAGHLGGVALDVYGTEPLPADSPLLVAAARHLDAMLLSPHIAGVTPEASRVLFESAWANIHGVLVAGDAPVHRVV